MKLILIRHGKTEASLKRQYCGITDLPLCEEGMVEINSLIKEGIYESLKPEMFFTSGLARATQTLEMIFPGCEYARIEALREMNFGKFEMFTHDELTGDKDYIKFIEDTTGDFVCPGGESANAFYKRVDEGIIRLLNEVKSSGAESAVLVSHGGPISRFIQKYTVEPNYYEAQPAQGRGYLIELNFEKGSVSVLSKAKI
ncbi:MAG: histidine phosphatase family protein [Eubacteriaceae bacterium]|nr:histidine phosphatase family protein [Eubacteriaceae bacterium]